MTEKQIIERFRELIEAGDAVLATKHAVFNKAYVERVPFGKWTASSLSFIGRVMGKDSEHYAHFQKMVNLGPYFGATEMALGSLKGALEDFEGGWLISTRRLVTAEVFSDFLDQARYFLNEGYFQVACVIAGSVFEESLRNLCANKGIPLPPKPKLDSMNAELAKAQAYDKMVQKKVTWLADIRNKAAHGKWKEFTADDAADMLKGVERFISDFGR